MWGADMLLNINAKEPLIVIYNCYLSKKVFLLYMCCFVNCSSPNSLGVIYEKNMSCHSVQQNHTQLSTLSKIALDFFLGIVVYI